MKAPKDRQDYEFEEKSEKDFEIAEMMERLQNSMGGMGGMGGMGEGTVDTRAGGGGGRFGRREGFGKSRCGAVYFALFLLALVLKLVVAFGHPLPPQLKGDCRHALTSLTGEPRSSSPIR